MEGCYNNPLFFEGVDKSATEVKTDDDKIAKAYEEVGVPVTPITVKPAPKASKKK